MRLAIAAGIAVGMACGRLGFDTPRTSVDAPGDSPGDAAAPMPALVAMTGSSTGDGSSSFTTFQVAFPTARTGDLLVVAVAEHHGDTVTGVVDDTSHALSSAGARAANGGTASELWYEVAASPTSSVTVSINVASNFDVWVAELSGTHAGAPASVGGNCAVYPPSIVDVPGMTTTANELVVTVMMAAAPMYVSGALPPFTTFPPLTGNGAAYYVPAQPGSYGVTWGIASGSGMTATTCASTAVWMPAP